VPLDRAGRFIVGQDLTVPGHNEVYVVGDLACLMQDGALVPGVAPAAIQEARHAAQNIVRSLRGESTLPFRYHNKGMLATIGRSAAVADLGRFKFSGTIAWLAWLFLHVMFLVGFRNRFIVIFQWAWSFITYDRGARLITGPIRRDAEQTGANQAVTQTQEPSPDETDEATPAARGGKGRVT
jgi:NADH dehydrogenase